MRWTRGRQRPNRQISFEETFRQYSIAAARLEEEVLGADRTRGADPTGVLEVTRLWMQAARSLQMGENWRAQAGTWEWLGNVLGTAICDEDQNLRCVRYRPREGRENVDRFFTISDTEWVEPKDEDGHPYQDAAASLSHQRAWAFGWAGEAARSASQYEEAARLFRRAGIYWEKSQHTARHRRAANDYFRAALVAAQSSRIETRSFITGKYCPSCVAEKYREKACPKEGHLGSQKVVAGEGPASDLDRLYGCWEMIRRGLATESPSKWRRPRQGKRAQQQEHPDSEERRQLTVLQHALAANGERTKARDVYRREQLVAMKWSSLRRQPVSWAKKKAHWLVSCGSSHVGRFLCSLGVLYFLLLPLLWWASGVVEPVAATAPGQALEALVFSATTMMTLSTGYFETGNWLVLLMQALQALSSFFALGYVLWIAQRSYAN